ncbi:hypothetical protein EMCRGX_G003140 [Ephydatia muelleri]
MRFNTSACSEAERTPPSLPSYHASYLVTHLQISSHKQMSMFSSLRTRPVLKILVIDIAHATSEEMTGYVAT